MTTRARRIGLLSGLVLVSLPLPVPAVDGPDGGVDAGTPSQPTSADEPEMKQIEAKLRSKLAENSWATAEIETMSTRTS